MKTRVYLVRHGDVYNPDQILYGRIAGFRLSAIGRSQAKTLGMFLSKKPVHTVFASPLKRTRQTASYIRAHHAAAPFVIDKRLIEVHTPLQGESMPKLENDGWNFYQEKYFSMGGERLEDIAQRMNSFFSEIVPRFEGREIVVVSHGDPIMLTAAIHTGKPVAVESIRTGNYVGTAKGFQLDFENSDTARVTPLEF